MKQFFKHFGSKARLANRLQPPRRHLKKLQECFAGSAAYTVKNAEPHHDVDLYDLNEEVCMIWDFLIRATPRDILTLPGDEMHDGRDVRDISPRLGQAQELFLKRWLGIGGAGQNSIPPCLRGVKTGTNWDEKTRARIAHQVPLIKHWKIHNASYETAPNVEAHRHIDPHYQHNAIGHSVYKCPPLDYEKLAAWCKSRRGDITVHEQHGANWLPFRTLDAAAKTSRDSSGGEKKTAHEVWWANEFVDRSGTVELFGSAS